MSHLTHIIAIWHVDHWLAWFENMPDVVSNEFTVNDAIYALMQIHGLRDLRTVERVTVDDGTTTGRTVIRAGGEPKRLES